MEKKRSVSQDRKISIYPKPQMLSKIDKYMKETGVKHKTEVVYEALSNLLNKKS
jgi:metal-responsive CopG/Arc/MetJ family transcriptional regulator